MAARRRHGRTAEGPAAAGPATGPGPAPVPRTHLTHRIH